MEEKPPMIDPALSDRLHELADSVDPTFDVAGLRRRIASRSRRRHAVKVGVAGAGVAVMVGGVLAVREQRSEPSTATAAGPASATSDPATLEDCDVVLSGVRAAIPTPDAEAAKAAHAAHAAHAAEADAGDGGGTLGERGFKGIVTILSVDGDQLTFRADEADPAATTSGVALLDATTSWTDAGVPLDSPHALAVGEQLGLATTPGTDGVDHVILIDVGPSEPAAKGSSDDAKTPSDAPEPSVAPAATGKSLATVDSVDPTSITITLTDESAPSTPLIVDLAATPFFVGPTRCAPGAMTVGTQLGVGYHLGDAGQAVADIAILMP
jgi:hypothetical protein